MINDLIHMVDIPGNVKIMLSVHALTMQTHMLYLAIFQPAHLTVQFAFPTDLVCHYLTHPPLLYVSHCYTACALTFVLNYLSYYHLDAVQVIMFPIFHA